MSPPSAPDGGAAAAAAAAAPTASPRSSSNPNRMPLPRSAADALASPRDELVLELHMIAFSHYCARAKWYLGACGIGLEAVRPLLPVQHVPHMVALLKKFNAPRAKPTASSNSPAATPALAVYRRDNSSSTKTPLFLLQDSELIGRWAALRAQALGDGGAAARTLYGPGAKLSVVIEEKEEEEVAADGTTTTKKREVAMAALDYDQSKANTANPTPAELERRLSGALGVESRRLVYFYLLPARSLLMRLCALNTPAGSGFFTTRVTAPLWALAASFALPGLLGINAANVEKGLKKLDAEFEYLDALIEQRGCLVAGESQGEERVGAFLCGGGDKKSTTGGPSAADVSLAALAAPLAGDGVEGYGAYLPSESELPEAFRQVLRERYIDRPTARYARALWREHGAAAVAKAAGGSAPSAAAAPKL